MMRELMGSQVRELSLKGALSGCEAKTCQSFCDRELGSDGNRRSVVRLYVEAGQPTKVFDQSFRRIARKPCVACIVLQTLFGM